MTATFRAAFGLDIGERARARAGAYYVGLYAAIDGLTRNTAYFGTDTALQDRYLMGYADGLAQLAAFPFRPVTINPSRDNG